MRSEYYKFLSDNKLSDMFSHIPELSYSYKLIVLKELIAHYTIEQVNMALNEYELNYIKLNRVDIGKLPNTLKGIITRRIQE